MRILVFQHLDRESPSNIATYAREKSIGLDVVKLWDGQKVPSVSNYDALIVMGGSMGVYDEYRGKSEEIRAIQECIGKKPILGICLGAQLLAYALGSRVYPHISLGKRVKEIGYSTVQLTDSGKQSDLFKGLESPLTVLQWHGDTYDLPEGAKLLATNLICTNQAFSVGNAFGLQFHIEVKPDLVEVWVKDDATWAHEGFAMDDKKVLEDANRNADLVKKQCYSIMDNFLSI